MPRNFGLAALRAFSTIAAVGGVTRAAGLLNLTQSAVSMQLKRLEDALGQRLMERDGRGVRLTPEGEAALPLARRLVALNDALGDRMRREGPEGEIRLGVPHDIVPRAIPAVMRRFAAAFPKVRLTLISSVTRALHDLFARGGCDVMLGTEAGARTGGAVIARRPLVWVGAADATAHLRRPVPLAFAGACLFRQGSSEALEAAGIAWEMAVDAQNSRAIDATVAADLAVHAVIRGFETEHHVRLPEGALPRLGTVAVTLYAAPDPDAARAHLVDLLREEYGGGGLALAAE